MNNQSDFRDRCASRRVRKEIRKIKSLEDISNHYQYPLRPIPTSNAATSLNVAMVNDDHGPEVIIPATMFKNIQNKDHLRSHVAGKNTLSKDDPMHMATMNILNEILTRKR